MFSLIIDNVKTRIAGDKAKANAQIGLVHPPAGDGKIIWLLAGKSRQSVLLACGLMAAIRDRRQDVRLVLTYQTEFKSIIVQHLSGLKKIGFGYGCSDIKMAALAMVKNLSPFAVIFVGEKPSASMLSAIKYQNQKQKKQIHSLLFQTSCDTDFDADCNTSFEASYPDYLSTVSSANSITGFSTNSDKNSVEKTLNNNFISPDFEAITRLVQSQVEKQLSAMLCGKRFSSLFLLHAPGNHYFESVFNEWRSNVIFNNALLVISCETPSDSENANTDSIAMYKSIVEAGGYKTLLLSEWDKQPVESSTIILADEVRWFAALATSSVSIHLYRYESISFWQSLASGADVTIDPGIIASDHHPICKEIKIIENENQLIDYWLEDLSGSLNKRIQTDKIRKYFWSIRRQAEKQIEDLLQRVYSW